MATSRIVEHVGRVLGDRYRLTRPLGTGASAHVYVAEDVTLRRRVAVKLLHPALAGDDGFLRRFQAEARVVAALRHPNIVRVYDWGDDGGSPYLVMELLEGGSLRGVLDRGRLLSVAQAARIGADVARALDYAHRRGLVHRDIKPANLLFDDEGQVSVADFGLARALAEASWTEPVGAVLGTARYAAPEQMTGAALDGHADVYALALVLVEAVSGKVPFAADTTIGTLMARVDRDLPVPDELGPLREALAAAGRSRPDDRSDAATLASALSAVAAQLPPAERVAIVVETERTAVEDDPHPTELPGRPALFDGEEADGTDEGAADALGAAAGPAAAGRRSGSTAASAGAARRSGSAGLGVGQQGSGRPAAGGPPPGGRGTASAGFSPPSPAQTKTKRRRWLIVALVVVLLAAAAGGGVVLLRSSTPRHPVPSVVGDTLAQATQALVPLHFGVRVAQRTYSTKYAVGAIVSQDRPVGARLREGSTVPVVVSLGPPPVTVPDLSTLPLDDAKNRLIGAGLQPGTVMYQYDNAQKGTVLSWTGKGGQLPQGSAVNLVVSNGPPTVPVPALPTSDTFAAAQAALGGLNLVAVEDDEYNNTVPKGQVVGTRPAAGVSVQVGTHVTVVISKGPHLVVVPDVHSQTVLQATAALAGFGLNVSGVNGNPSKAVSKTVPPAGSTVLFGSSVTLVT